MPTPISPAIIGENELLLFYGKPKTGKTFCALTAPPPVYFITVGSPNEAKVFYSKPFQDKYGKLLKEEDLLIDVGSSSQEVKDLASKAIEDDLSGKGPQFASIVVDNATPLIQLQLDVAFLISHDRMKDKGKSALKKLEDYGATIPHEDDWGIAQGIMRRFISELVGVNKHVILISHEYQTYSSGGQGSTPILEKVEPWFIGKDRTQIANTFDNVWRFDRAAAGAYTARTEAGRGNPGGYAIVAGSRIGGVIPKDFDDPNVTKAIKLFRAHAEEVSSKQK
jgi:hypothetical protein